MQRDHVGHFEQVIERLAAPGVAERELVGRVVEVHGHAEVLGQHRQLRADVAVPDDAERTAADLMAAVGIFVPDAGVHLFVLLGEPPGERDDLGQGELDDAAGIGERCVEDGDAGAGGGGEIDLVGTDAECADHGQSLGRAQHPRGDLCLRPDAEQAHVLDALDQLVLVERAGHRFDDVALGLEPGHRLGMDVLQQECPDLPVGHSRPFPPANAGHLRGNLRRTGFRGVRAGWPRVVRALRQRSVTVGPIGHAAPT